MPIQKLYFTPPRVVHEMLIIGSGCAGFTAALYGARANLSPILFEGSQPGGQLTITSDVENYPGFPSGILGSELMDKMKEQAIRFGTKVISEQVTKVDFGVRPFKIWVGDLAYESKTVIVATGASAQWLHLESEQKLVGKGVSACATCDAFFFKNQHVVVVGGGDSAMEEATFLAKFASKVTVIHRRSGLRASKIMQQRAMDNKKIGFIWDSEVTEVLDVSQGKVTGVLIHNLKTKQKSLFNCDGLFLAIGHNPNTELFKGKLKLDEKGYIVTKAPSTATDVPGVFACGDVQDHVYRQAITAAGSGCAAAIDAERFLSGQK